MWCSGKRHVAAQLGPQELDNRKRQLGPHLDEALELGLFLHAVHHAPGTMLVSDGFHLLIDGAGDTSPLGLELGRVGSDWASAQVPEVVAVAIRVAQNLPVGQVGSSHPEILVQRCAPQAVYCVPHHQLEVCP